MPTILLSAPYMLPYTDRFKPVFAHYGLEVIAPKVEERLEEEDILQYANQFDATICGDDRYSRRVLQGCLPRLKVVSKWGTGIDSIDQVACKELGIQLKNTPNAFTLPVADSVLGYMLAFARRQELKPESIDIRTLVSGMIELLSKRYNLNAVDAYMLCSVCGDLRISEIVDMPNWVVSFYFPRVVFE